MRFNSRTKTSSIFGITPVTVIAGCRMEEKEECDHIWEELEDGTIICFECDKVKKKDED